MRVRSITGPALAAVVSTAASSGCGMFYATSATALAASPVGAIADLRELRPAAGAGGIVYPSRGDVDSGGGGALWTTTMPRIGSHGVAMASGHAEAGYLDHRAYGLAGLTIGGGLALADIGGLGLETGWLYGGLFRTGSTIPLKASLRVHTASFTGYVSAHGGWRWSADAGEREPEAFGPGWREWGLESGMLIGRKPGFGLGVIYRSQDHGATLGIRVTLWPGG